MASPEESPQSRLERQLEQALRAGRSKSFLLPQLERLAAMADAGSRAWCFANKTIAELLIEQAPWRAAVHARRVSVAVPDDEAAHALLGLALAVQSNYRAAISAYRRALAIDPRNPWYAHNIGHLYDVALDQPRDGLAFLQRAHREAPEQDDVASSLAHCLARTNRRPEALELAAELAARRPDRQDFSELHAWIARGDTPDPGATSLLAPTSFEAALAEPIAGARTARALIEAAPLDDAQRASAIALLDRCERSQAARSERDEHALAAAIEYAVRKSEKPAPSQRSLAEKYAISLHAFRSQAAAVQHAMKSA